IARQTMNRFFNLKLQKIVDCVDRYFNGQSIQIKVFVGEIEYSNNGVRYRDYNKRFHYDNYGTLSTNYGRELPSLEPYCELGFERNYEHKKITKPTAFMTTPVDNWSDKEMEAITERFVYLF